MYLLITSFSFHLLNSVLTYFILFHLLNSVLTYLLTWRVLRVAGLWYTAKPRRCARLCATAFAVNVYHACGSQIWLQCWHVQLPKYKKKNRIIPIIPNNRPIYRISTKVFSSSPVNTRWQLKSRAVISYSITSSSLWGFPKKHLLYKQMSYYMGEGLKSLAQYGYSKISPRETKSNAIELN